MSIPLKKPDASEILQAPDAPLVPPAALDRPPANWAEAAELAQWAEHEGPPPPADDDMSEMSYNGWLNPAPMPAQEGMSAGWWIFPAMIAAGIFWWNLIGWLIH